MLPPVPSVIFRFATALLGLGLATPAAHAANHWTPGAGWTLTWSDEFDGSAVNPENWTYDLGTGNGWGNNELQSYTTANAFIEGGALIIEARKNSDHTYTSARLKTQGLRSWQYGKIAARLRLPYGQGIWPAFWMLGDRISLPASPWPKCGEIDIMEMIGGGENRDDTHYATLHWDTNNAHTYEGSGARELPDPQSFHEDFHVFEIEWTRREVIWKLDTVEFYRLGIDPALKPAMEEFHHPFFIIFNLAVGGNWPGYPDATTVFPQRMAVDWVRVYSPADPYLATSPASQSANEGASVTFTAAGGGTAPFTYQWRKAGVPLAGATSATFTLANVTPADASSYDVVVTNSFGSATSPPAALGLATTSKVTGTAVALDADIRHPNGKIFDQVLLNGPAATITADSGQVTRLSYIDADDDIVQVEFAGPGTLALTLAGASPAANPVNYHQDVAYAKGHAGIVITGATEQTNVSVFSIGRATAFDPSGTYDITKSISDTNDPANNRSPLFEGHAATAYDGIADLAFIAIVSANGKFGGIRTANAHYFASQGMTGVYAPGVAFEGPLYVGDITAFGAAFPVLQVGAVTDARIAGGSLAQANGAPVQVSGLAQLTFAGGSDSHGRSLEAQSNQASLKEDGVDVTAALVVNP